MALGSTIYFNGRAIFGLYENRINGPIAKSRILRHRLPGVPGYRIFRLTGDNIDGRIWTCEGRIVGLNLRSVMQAVIDAQSLMNGRLFIFQTNAGVRYANCELVDFRPASKYQRIRLAQDVTRDYHTVMVRGTIEQASI